MTFYVIYCLPVKRVDVSTLINNALKSIAYFFVFWEIPCVLFLGFASKLMIYFLNNNYHSSLRTKSSNLHLRQFFFFFKYNVITNKTARSGYKQLKCHRSIKLVGFVVEFVICICLYIRENILFCLFYITHLIFDFNFINTKSWLTPEGIEQGLWNFSQAEKPLSHYRIQEVAKAIVDEAQGNIA